MLSYYILSHLENDMEVSRSGTTEAAVARSDSTETVVVAHTQAQPQRHRTILVAENNHTAAAMVADILRIYQLDFRPGNTERCRRRHHNTHLGDYPGEHDSCC